MQHCGLRGARLPGALLHCGRDPGTQKCFGAGDVSAQKVLGMTFLENVIMGSED